MKKVWKDIEGFEGYQVNNIGEVRSYMNNRHGPTVKEPHPVKSCKNKHGYDTVQLGRGNRRLVHRLVAQAFIPNPKNLPLVRHIDDNPDHNYVSNLKWGTQANNMQDCVRHGRLVGDTRAAIEATKKPVIAENLTTKEILEFKSCSDAARALNIPPASRMWPNATNSWMDVSVSIERRIL